MLFGASKRLNLFHDRQVNLSVNGSPVNTTTSYKYVGVHLDRTLNFETHFHKIYTRRHQEEWIPFVVSIQALILLLSNEFANWWLCRYLRIAAIIVLDGQSPANAWSASLRNKASQTLPRNAVRRTAIFDVLPIDNFLQKKTCCFVFDCLNGTTCLPFSNYFQRFHHNSLKTKNNGKATKLTQGKTGLCVPGFLIHCH